MIEAIHAAGRMLWLRIGAVFNRVFGDALNPLYDLGAYENLIEPAQRWARECPNSKFVPVLSEPGPEDVWDGRTGLVHEAILADFPDRSGYLVYACGSVRMIEAVKPAFVAQGLSEDQCFSDAFTPQAAAPVTPG